MVAEHALLNLEAFQEASLPRINPAFQLDLSDVEEKVVYLQTPYGSEKHVFENLPNNMEERRDKTREWMTKETVDSVGVAHGYMAETLTLRFLTDIFPEFVSFPLPKEFEPTHKGTKGADLGILNSTPTQVKGNDVYEPLMLVDVTTKCFSAVGRKKRAGLNPALGVPVMVLPIGELYRTPDTRINSYFEMVMRRFLRGGIFDPFAGITDTAEFNRMFVQTFHNSLLRARYAVEYDKHYNEKAVDKRILDKFDFVQGVVEQKINQLW